MYLIKELSYNEFIKRHGESNDNLFRCRGAELLNKALHYLEVGNTENNENFEIYVKIDDKDSNICILDIRMLWFRENNITKDVIEYLMNYHGKINIFLTVENLSFNMQFKYFDYLKKLGFKKIEENVEGVVIEKCIE